jgi:MFS family permease
MTAGSANAELKSGGGGAGSLLAGHGWWLLIAASFLMDFNVSMANLAVQFLGIHRLSASNAVLGFFAASFSFTYAMCCTFSGGISDRFGRRVTACLACAACVVVWGVMPLLPSWKLVLVAMPLAGASLSLYWPSVQAWLAELTAGRPGGLRRAVGVFNISWCLGLMLGMVMTGRLWSVDYRLTLWLPAGLLILLMVIMVLTPAAPARAPGAASPASGIHPEDTATQQDTRRFMWLAWVGNFASWFAAGALLALFPKLGDVLGYGPFAVGVTTAAFRFGQVCMCAWALHSGLWQYRLAPLIAVEAAAVVAFVFGLAVDSAWAFGAIFIVGGLAGGLTYASSLFYSLATREGGRGRKSGLHEAVLGSGAFLGPLAGGLAAQFFGLRAPFVVAVVVLSGAILVQLRLAATRVPPGLADEIPVPMPHGAAHETGESDAPI